MDYKAPELRPSTIDFLENKIKLARNNTTNHKK